MKFLFNMFRVVTLSYIFPKMIHSILYRLPSYKTCIFMMQIYYVIELFRTDSMDLYDLKIHFL